MAIYGQLTVVVDSSMSSYASRLDTLFNNLQSLSVASSLFSVTKTIEIRLDNSSGSHQGSGIISINSSDFDNVKYIDFYGKTNLLTFERLITHETIHAVLGKGDPLPFNAPLSAYIALLQDPSFDPIGETVRMTNDIMAQAPFQENGQMHYFNLIYPDETNPLRLISSYTNESIIDDVIHGTVLSANDVIINRVGSVIGDDRPTDDLIIGYNGNETIFAGGGYDHIYDGSGADIIEGGDGSDTIYLSDDGTRDIVIVDDDNDVIRGGGSQDRLVLRGTNFGGGDDTQGLALLGGFRMSGGIEAAFELQQKSSITWEQWKAFLGDPDAEQGDSQDEWDTVSTAQEWPFVDDLSDQPGRFIRYYTFEGEGGAEGLGIVYSFFDMSADAWSTGSVQIDDFQEGDFGIQFFDLTHIDGMRGQLGGTYSADIVANQAAFDHIWNSGQLIVLPESPEEPGQQRQAPQHDMVIPVPLIEVENDQARLADDRRPINLDTAVQVYDGGHPPGWIAAGAWHSAYLADGSEFAYGLAEGVADIELLGADFEAIQARVPGDAWYEPEPIGGLV
ncbi:calcium-binding protein [Mesorhizobium comanense]|uniref:calcium-binding protein n=1 Tax=Mesorhizobium comanense TaxID=2502215 RepID=UPI0010F71872|nr:calcium-binding protein [Mesorhizobium comanense]